VFNIQIPLYSHTQPTNPLLAGISRILVYFMYHYSEYL